MKVVDNASGWWFLSPSLPFPLPVMWTFSVTLNVAERVLGAQSLPPSSEKRAPPSGSISGASPAASFFYEPLGRAGSPRLSQITFPS